MGTPIGIAVTYIIHWSRLGAHYTAGPGPIDNLSHALSLIQNTGGTVDSIQQFDSGGGPVGPCPDGFSWDPDQSACLPIVINPPPPPVLNPTSGGDDTDEPRDLQIQIGGYWAQILVWIAELLKLLKDGGGQGGAELSICCKALVAALVALDATVDEIAVELGKQSTPPAPLDLSAVTKDLDSLAQSVAEIAKVLSTPEAQPKPTDLSGVIKAINDASQPPEARKAVLDWMLRAGLLEPDQGQLLGDPAVLRIDPARFHPVIRKLFSKDPAERHEGVNWLLSTLGVLLKSVGLDVTAEIAMLEADPASAVKAAWTKLEAHGHTLIAAFAPILEPIPRTVLDEIEKIIAGAGGVTPDNALDVGFKILGTAFVQGQGIHLITAIAGYMGYPMSSVWGHNAAAAVALTGYDEITSTLQKGFYDAAIGTSSRYHFRGKYKPDFPREFIGAGWRARRLIDADQLKAIFAVSGLRREFETAETESAYRPVSPRAIATAYIDVTFPRDAVRAMMEFAGNRDQDIETMLDAFEQKSITNVRNQYLTALMRSAELGTLTDTDLVAALHDLDFSDQAIHFVRLTVAERKLEQLDQLYRKSVSSAYEFGQITDADYVPHLEAIGIAEADAEAHYAIDSIKKRGRADAKAEREAASLIDRQKRAAMAAALAGYRSGAGNDATLLAELLGAGIDPGIAGFAVAIASARREGSTVFIYGLILPRADAAILRERVSAIEDQAKKQLITYDQALAGLDRLGIPAANARALTAAWAALTAATTKHGQLEPI